MAKAVEAPKATKSKPRASVHWDGSDINLTGDTPGMGDRVRLVIDGKVTGFSLQEYGNSIEVEAKAVKVEHHGSAEEGESLVDLVKGLKKKR